MLQVCRDDMVARTKQTEDRRIQCFRRIAGKADPLRAAAAEKVRQLLPGVVNHPGGAEGAAIDTPATVAQRLHRLGHRLNDAGRPPQRRGRVIQINHAWTPFPRRAHHYGRMIFPAPFIFSTIWYIFVTEPTANCSVRP